MLKHLFSLSFFLLLPFFAHAEYINSFDSQIEVQKDSSFQVTETIEYVFSEPKHGIFRYIPLTHPEASSHFLKERVIDVSVESVQVDGRDVPYTEEGERDQFFLKIGDPNDTITNTHTYVIRYEVRGGLSYPKNQGPELYYNITGNGWEVPMHSVSATISSPDPIFLSNRSCYRDLSGGNASCAQTKRDDGSVVFRTTELMPKEGMTIAQALDVRGVDHVVLERFKLLWILIPLIVLAVGALGFFMYRYKTAYKTGRTIIPQYEPYPGIKPMYTGLLMDGRLDSRDITACIVYLAEQGFIKIRKTEKKVLFVFEVDDYEMTLLKLPDVAVSSFEVGVVELLFDKPLTVGKTISLNDLKTSRSEQRENYKELQSLKQKLDVDLVLSGFYEGRGVRTISFAKFKKGLVWGIVLVVFFLILPDQIQGISFIIAFVLGIAVPVFIVTGRRTRVGYEVQDYLKGFKLFLEMTERDRYAFHNAPEKNPEQFMEYLPYAIAFGVEEKWAKVFEGITIPNPDWYEGGSAGSFSPAGLTSSLGAFSTAFAASSGTSASSGGGHSGGGSGGGGGGSW